MSAAGFGHHAFLESNLLTFREVLDARIYKAGDINKEQEETYINTLLLVHISVSVNMNIK
jgi:hypothetical protein